LSFVHKKKLQIRKPIWIVGSSFLLPPTLGLAAVLEFIFFSPNVSPIEKLKMKICTKDE